METEAFLAAVSAGYNAVTKDLDLVCFGEMGIGNTTPAAAISAALFGGGAQQWTGRGTGVDDAGLNRKIAAIEAGLKRHADALSDPLAAAAALGGRELAAILGATLAARHLGIPVLLDGFVCSAAVAPLAKLHPEGLAHTLAAHVSAEAGHRRLLEALGLPPLLDLGMRLGEGSGACLAVNIVRSALECHASMASFAEAGVSEK
jgi:nicotinate-nucleotide--dimethylbenzimidazole phosphoribosyltransferase